MGRGWREEEEEVDGGEERSSGYSELKKQRESRGGCDVLLVAGHALLPTRTKGPAALLLRFCSSSRPSVEEGKTTTGELFFETPWPSGVGSTALLLSRPSHPAHVAISRFLPYHRKGATAVVFSFRSVHVTGRSIVSTCSRAYRAKPSSNFLYAVSLSS